MLESFSTLIGVNTMPTAEVFVRLALAAAMGFVIGLDREMLSKPAGLRTQALIALASASFTMLGIELGDRMADIENNVRTDPVRIIEAVIAGVGFLGAGAIIQTRRGVSGLTTGAAMWLSGAVGIACGAGFYTIACATLFIGVILLFVFRHMQHAIEDRAKQDGSAGD